MVAVVVVVALLAAEAAGAAGAAVALAAAGVAVVVVAAALDLLARRGAAVVVSIALVAAMAAVAVEDVEAAAAAAAALVVSTMRLEAVVTLEVASLVLGVTAVVGEAVVQSLEVAGAPRAAQMRLTSFQLSYPLPIRACPLEGRREKRNTLLYSSAYLAR